MLIPNHPADERLSALAAHDPDAVSDSALATHVGECARCEEIVNELRSLTLALAELPDIPPPRPLRLLPDVEPSRADGAAGWMRRIFAPVMVAGTALALVGMVGTVSPNWAGSAATGGAPEERQEMASDSDNFARSQALAPAAGGENLRSEGDRIDDPGTMAQPSDEAVPARDAISPPFERSIWPMVLFTGVALLIGAALLRWILVPRAG
jgi:hypothetical protein